MGAALQSSKVAIQKKPTTFLDVPGCEFSPTALQIEPGLNLDHWERLGEMLRRTESGVQWWLGDWMVYGEQEFEEKYAQAIDAHEQTGINVDTLRNYQWVSERVPVVMRITGLPWSYHQVVAALPHKEQTMWLERAKLEGWTFRELKREVEKAERKKNFKLVSSILEKIWERIQDGCYTSEAISKCSECGSNMFGLELAEIELYMQQLVGSGKAEWRKQGGKTEVGRGEPTTLCVPKDLPAGSDFDMPGYRPVVEYGDDKEEHF